MNSHRTKRNSDNASLFVIVPNSLAFANARINSILTKSKLKLRSTGNKKKKQLKFEYIQSI